jgi:hypothetical protein
VPSSWFDVPTKPKQRWDADRRGGLMESGERTRCIAACLCYGAGVIVSEADAPRARSDYLDRLMRRASFQALWPLFAKADKPAKEMTESFSALVHLRPCFPASGPFRVIHVGDGAHARTAALFALKTRAENISIDPILNLPLVSAWRNEYAIERLVCHRARIQDTLDMLNSLPAMPTLVTFVHAHVNIDEVLGRIKWVAAYTLACCVPAVQLSRAHMPSQEGDDGGVLSSCRHYQVLVNVH